AGAGAHPRRDQRGQARGCPGRAQRGEPRAGLQFRVGRAVLPAAPGGAIGARDGQPPRARGAVRRGRRLPGRPAPSGVARPAQAPRAGGGPARAAPGAGRDHRARPVHAGRTEEARDRGTRARGDGTRARGDRAEDARRSRHTMSTRNDTPLTRRSMFLEVRRTLDAVAKAFIQAVTTPPTLNEGAVVGGIGSTLAVLVGAGGASLWVAGLVLSLAGVRAGPLHAVVRPGEEVGGAPFIGGFLGKLLLLLLVPGAGGGDAVASLLPEVAELTDGLPATTVVLCA